MNKINALHRYYLALWLIFLILLVTGNAFAQRVSDLTPEQQREQDLSDLRFMQKEVAKMRYSEFCSIVHIPKIETLQHLQEAAQKGDPAAQDLFNSLFPLVEHYNKVGCGDA